MFPYQRPCLRVSWHVNIFDSILAVFSSCFTVCGSDWINLDVKNIYNFERTPLSSEHLHLFSPFVTNRKIENDELMKKQIDEMTNWWNNEWLRIPCLKQKMLSKWPLVPYFYSCMQLQYYGWLRLQPRAWGKNDNLYDADGLTRGCFLEWFLPMRCPLFTFCLVLLEPIS